MAAIFGVLKIILQFIIGCRFPEHVSLAEITRYRYDNITLDTFRSWERSSIKLTKAKEGLNFLNQCKDANLFLYFCDLNYQIGD